MSYDRARVSLDRHATYLVATYIVATYIAVAPWHDLGAGTENVGVHARVSEQLGIAEYAFR